MGTHPNCPSLLSGSSVTLKEWLSKHPEALGDKVNRRFQGDLPYLFKVRRRGGGGGGSGGARWW